MRVAWEYDTSGPIGVDKNILLEVDLDGKWHEYEFVIPAGGRYLKRVKIEYISFPGRLEWREWGLKTITPLSISP